MKNDRYCHGVELEQRIQSVNQQWDRLCQIAPKRRESVTAFCKRHEKIRDLRERVAELSHRHANELKEQLDRDWLSRVIVIQEEVR